MKKILFRELYWFVMDSTIFSLPVLRKFRGYILKMYLNSKHYIKCGSRVMIKAAHPNAESVFSCKEGLALGSNAYIDYTGSVEIGAYVTVSEGVRIFTHDHIIDRSEERRVGKECRSRGVLSYDI